MAVADDWRAAIDSFLLSLRSAGRPKTTVGLRRTQLGWLAAASDVGPWQVTHGQLVAFMGERAERWALDTLRSMRSALRTFYRWAFGEGLVPVDPAARLMSVRTGKPNPRRAPEQAYRSALVSATPRDRLMVRLAADLGLRRGEVCQVHSDDIEDDLTGDTLVVHGKGGKVRRTPLPPGLAVLIRAQCGEGGGFAFPGRSDGHLSPAYVGKRVARLLPGAWTMHSLRHRFGTTAYGIEKDIAAVQELMGHASIATTRLYVQVPAEQLRRTVEAVAALTLV